MDHSSPPADIPSPDSHGSNLGSVMMSSGILSDRSVSGPEWYTREVLTRLKEAERDIGVAHNDIRNIIAGIQMDIDNGVHTEGDQCMSERTFDDFHNVCGSDGVPLDGRTSRPVASRLHTALESVNALNVLACARKGTRLPFEHRDDSGGRAFFSAQTCDMIRELIEPHRDTVLTAREAQGMVERMDAARRHLDRTAMESYLW